MGVLSTVLAGYIGIHTRTAMLPNKRGALLERINHILLRYDYLLHPIHFPEEVPERSQRKKAGCYPTFESFAIGQR